MSDQVREVAAGSSPLTRGKHEAWAFDAEAGRLIPAHAGKTGHCQVGLPEPAAHPRSRGENYPACST